MMLLLMSLAILILVGTLFWQYLSMLLFMLGYRMRLLFDLLFFYWNINWGFFLFWFDFELLRYHCLNTVVHILHKINLWSAKSPFIRNIIDVIISLCMFTMSTSDLDVILVCNCLKLGLVLAKIWQMDMDWSSQSCSKISWTRSNISKMFIVSKFSDSFNMSTCFG